MDWLDDDEMRAWRNLVEVMGDVTAALEVELLADHGIDMGDYGVLVHLSEAEDERMRMCDLAGRLHLSPSGLTRRIDGLVRAGLVTRAPAPDDRRVSLAVLTQAGRRKIEGAAPDHVAGVRRHLLEHLTAAQIRQVGIAMEAARAKRQAAALAPR